MIETFCLKKLTLGAGTLGMLPLLGLPANAEETGEKLFRGKRAMCHGLAGSGKTMMGEKLKISDLRSADIQKKTDADLKALIAKGKDKMPAYETKLSSEQVEKLVVYVWDLAKKH